MPEIYAKLIILGKKTIEDVPEHLRDEVRRRWKELAGENDTII